MYFQIFEKVSRYTHELVVEGDGALQSEDVDVPQLLCLCLPQCQRLAVAQDNHHHSHVDYLINTLVFFNTIKIKGMLAVK